MLQSLLHAVTQLIAAAGLPGVMLLMALESACIPIPSEVIMPFAGYLVFRGDMNFHLASMAGAVGCAIGSAVAYWIGSKGGRPFIEHYGRYVLLRHKDLDAADRFFAKYGDAAIFFSRLMPVVRTFISLPAGISRMNFPRFMVYSFVGSIPWCYLMTYIGMKLGEKWKSIQTYFHGADLIIGGFILLGIIFFLWHHLKPEKPR